jgi:hypothetical protein
VGPALTAALLLVFGGGPLGYRVSIGSLAIVMAAGLIFLLRVPDVRPEGTVDEYAVGVPKDAPDATPEGGISG